MPLLPIVFAAGSQVPSAFLNALEAIVARGEVNISHNAFILRSGAAAVDSTTWTVTANSTFQAPLALPVGKHIVELGLGYDRGNGTATFELVAVSTLTGTPPVATNIFTDNASAGYQHATSAVDIEILADKQYYLRVSLSGTTGSLYNAKVNAKHPEFL